MLYSEFIKGTGCRENDHNYKVYKDLEVMYMNSDISKAQIYEYGKKLVNNSKSEERLALEDEIKSEIKALKEKVKEYKEDIERYESYLDCCGDPAHMQMYKDAIKGLKLEIKHLKTQQELLKLVLRE